MPASTSHKAGMAAAGFTLIEILVVLVIISIIMTFAMLSFGDFGAKRAVVAEGQRFVHTLNLVKQEAVLEETTLAIRIHSRGYQVFRFKVPNQWQAIKSTVFHHQFHKALAIHFRAHKQTQLIVSPSGITTPFEFSMGTENEPNMITITGKADGSVTVNNHD